MGTGVIATVVSTRAWIEEDKKHQKPTVVPVKPSKPCQPSNIAPMVSPSSGDKINQNRPEVEAKQLTPQRQIVQVENVLNQPGQTLQAETKKEKKQEEMKTSTVKPKEPSPPTKRQTVHLQQIKAVSNEENLQASNAGKDVAKPNSKLQESKKPAAPSKSPPKPASNLTESKKPGQQGTSKAPATSATNKNQAGLANSRAVKPGGTTASKSPTAKEPANAKVDVQKNDPIRETKADDKNKKEEKKQAKPAETNVRKSVKKDAIPMDNIFMPNQMIDSNMRSDEGIKNSAKPLQGTKQEDNKPVKEEAQRSQVSVAKVPVDASKKQNVNKAEAEKGKTNPTPQKNKAEPAKAKPQVGKNPHDKVAQAKKKLQAEEKKKSEQMEKQLAKVYQ